MIEVGPAKASDIARIQALVEPQAARRILLPKDTVGYYESVQEFRVARDGDDVVGCGALHVMWHDLGEIRTLTVRDDYLGRGVGAALLTRLIDDAYALGLGRLFCLTFEVEFFRRHGFEVIEGTPVEPEVYAELLRSYDVGVAQFLDLERAKPNTLGNIRMLRKL